MSSLRKLPGKLRCHEMYLFNLSSRSSRRTLSLSLLIFFSFPVFLYAPFFLRTSNFISFPGKKNKLFAPVSSHGFFFFCVFFCSSSSFLAFISIDLLIGCFLKWFSMQKKMELTQQKEKNSVEVKCSAYFCIKIIFES